MPAGGSACAKHVSVGALTPDTALDSRHAEQRAPSSFPPADRNVVGIQSFAGRRCLPLTEIAPVKNLSQPSVLTRRKRRLLSA